MSLLIQDGLLVVSHKLRIIYLTEVDLSDVFYQLLHLPFVFLDLTNVYQLVVFQELEDYFLRFKAYISLDSLGLYPISLLLSDLSLLNYFTPHCPYL